MSRKPNTKVRLHGARGGFSVKTELLGFLCLLIGAFLYLCLLSFDPLDPSFFTTSNASIKNLGGLFGAYLAGSFMFLFGGAGYFIALYFLINAFLLFLRRRLDLRLIDFVVYLVCSVFIAVFLQVQFHQFVFANHVLNAGGTIGEILGEIGATYLGKWGVYLIVLFGAILTFILATKLSFVETINTSTMILGKGFDTLSGQFFITTRQLKKLSLRAWAGLFSMTGALVLKLKALKAKIQKNPGPQVVKHSATEATLPKPVQATIDIDKVLRQAKAEEPFIKKRLEEGAKKFKPKQLNLDDIAGGYQLPPLDFLDFEETKTVVDEASLKMSARILEKKLMDFDIEGQVTEIHPGPVITMYEFQPAPGVKISRIHSLADDLSLAMGGRPVRIVAPLPNKPAVGIEIPNFDREMVWLKDIIGDEKFSSHESKMIFALGKDIGGFPFVADLRKMPHLLVAGATGSGKSVAINSMICSILYKARPDEVRMIMIDPKMIELSIYEGIPHLLLPVVTDANKANVALKWVVREMERRYQLMADVNARNLSNYNKKIETGDVRTGKPSATALANDIMDENDKVIIHEGKLPCIVVIVDEFADLMMVASKDVETSICRLAQKARAAGIHVILATQRPSVDVITGIIKANFPSRIAFKVSARHDARTIMDNIGAEQLLGQGDMLFVPPGSSQPQRLHGAFISEEEIVKVVRFLKAQAKPVYNEEILESVDECAADGTPLTSEDLDELYDEAVREVIQSNRVSISSVQRRFRIGYNRAARLVEMMEQQGIVTAPNGQGLRQVVSQN